MPIPNATAAASLVPPVPQTILTMESIAEALEGIVDYNRDKVKYRDATARGQTVQDLADLCIMIYQNIEYDRATKPALPPVPPVPGASHAGASPPHSERTPAGGHAGGSNGGGHTGGSNGGRSKS